MICFENNGHQSLKIDKISFRVDNTTILWSDANWGCNVKPNFRTSSEAWRQLWRFQSPVNIMFKWWDVQKVMFTRRFCQNVELSEFSTKPCAIYQPWSQVNNVIYAWLILLRGFCTRKKFARFSLLTENQELFWIKLSSRNVPWSVSSCFLFTNSM